MISFPKVESGIIQLEEWNFSQNEIPLSGEWEFYWNEFISDDFIINAYKMHFASVPSHWIDLDSGSPERIEIQGRASFRARIHFQENHENLGLRIPPMDTAFVLYWNGVEIARNADIYEDKEEYFPSYYAPIVVPLDSIKKGYNTIHIHMANSIYPRPGFRDSIVLGDYRTLITSLNKKLFVDVFLTGALFIIGLYHLGIWVLRRKDVSTLYFSLLSLIMVLRIPMQGEAVAYQIFPIEWKLSTFFEYFTFYFAYGFIGKFIKSLYPKESIPIFDKMVEWSVGIFVAILIVFPLSIYTRTFLMFEILTIFLSIYYFYILVRATRTRRESAIGFIITLFIFLITYINDILYANRLIDSFYMTGLGLFIFFFSQGFLLSKRFSVAFNTAETLTKELDSKVKERTKALENEKLKSDLLLKNIQRDLNYSKRIQKSILPKIQNQKGFEIGVLYKPMDEVGGDIYDFFRWKKDRNKFRIMLADATGHGIQGALVTMAIKSEYENIKKFIRTPSELMEVLNISIINTYKTMYFSCVILDIDLDKKTLEYSSAGHPEQVIFRKDEFILLNKTGPMIGLKQNVEYKSVITEIKKKDILYMFSDGMFEIFNENQEEYGEEKFYNLLNQSGKLSPQERINHIMSSLKKFKGTNPFEDDMTLIIFDIL